MIEPEIKNFYLGARQKVDSSYSIEDYNHAFFGTLRFTTGQRYQEVSGSIEDTGTDNSISGVGLDPIYVNPIPSVTTILGMIAKPSLENWKINQALNSALTLEKNKGE